MHTGEGDTAPTFSGLGVYLQFMWEVGLPPSLVAFSSHCHFYKFSRSWLLGECCCSCWPAGLPPLLWSFPPSTTLTSFPAPGCWVFSPTPTGASPARPSLFIYSSGKDSPPFLFGAQCTPPSLLHVFIVLIDFYSVSLFPLGGGRSVQGAMLIWPRVVCGSTVYHLAHLAHIFPSHLGVGNWRPGSPSGFSI
jgi:hypothetical protein